MKKTAFIFSLMFITAFLSSCSSKVDPWEGMVKEKGINLHTYVYDREKDSTIDVYIEGYESGYSLGIFDKDSEPGSAKGAIRRKPIKNDIYVYSFEIKDLKKSGDYNLFLFDKNLDIVCDYEVVTILDDDENDYGVSSASINVTNNGLINSEIRINTTHLEELTYYLYWAKDNVRLEDYTYIKTFTSKDLDEIVIKLNDAMFAPEIANQIEVFVENGRSSSYFFNIPDTLKVNESTYLTSLQISSDTHIESKYTCKNYNSHFLSNLNAVKNYEHESEGLVFVGDTANTGNKNNYDLFYEYIDSVFETRPTLYPIVGNHELQYFTVYEDAINTYKENTGMPGAYFTFELGGFKCFALGSEDVSTHGVMSVNQLNWFKDEISKLGKDEKIMIFMHQGIYNTVSGTLEGHGWHGLNTKNNGIRDVIKQYKNAFVFSGHSHQDLNCVQTSLFGNGNDANYVNCGSSAYVLNDNREQVYGSTFYFVDVYEDYLILKGRLSIENKWISAAQFVIPFVK